MNSVFIIRLLEMDTSVRALLRTQTMDRWVTLIIDSSYLNNETLINNEIYSI